MIKVLRYAMPAWSGFLSAHLVGQINGLLKRAHRYGFTLDVISLLSRPIVNSSKV